MRNSLRRLAAAVTLLVAALTVGGCPSTWSYRSVQDRFEAAVRADNDGLTAPFVDSHRAVAAELTDEKIAALDPRLRANAYMMRAVCEWRAGEYAAAVESSDAGLDEVDDNPRLQGSRDHVVLALVPAVVVFDQTMHAWGGLERPLGYATYQTRLRPDLETAWSAFAAADAAMDRARTPPTIGYYVSYQRWRMLQGWQTVLSSIDPREEVPSPGNPSEKELAKTVARDALGTHLSDYVGEQDAQGKPVVQDARGWGKAVARARDSIPDGEPLRDLIRAHGGD